MCSVSSVVHNLIPLGVVTLPELYKACIRYIYHSCFAVTIEKHLLVFDYYKDNPSSGAKIDALLLDKAHNRDVYVFASHGHGDHFNPAIFEWKKRLPNLHFVLSHDIKQAKDRTDATIVQPGHKYSLGKMEIEVLDSTDLGVAFVVSCDDLTIFHAGDLNWWHWNGEPDEDNEAMAENYKKQINLLKGRHIDFAFVPVDPRLEEHYSLGLTYFMQTVGAQKVFPMHFGVDYSVFQRLKKGLAPEFLKHIAEITATDRQFVY